MYIAKIVTETANLRNHIFKLVHPFDAEITFLHILVKLLRD